MGDRANIIVKSMGEQVCLYSHWGGTELPETLKAALIRGKGRWDDFPYLARIIFCEMVRGDVEGETGYGISQTIGDGGDKVLVVDVDAQKIEWRGHSQTSFKAFCALKNVSWGSV